jgi:hypothetical protein
MSNDTTDRRTRHRMMTRHVTHNATDRGAFDTAVSTTNDGDRGNKYRDCDSEQYCAHVDCLL